MTPVRTLTLDAVRLRDPAATANEIADALRRIVHDLHRTGAVVVLTGGVDSTVVATLAARALGPDHVLGLLLPDVATSVRSLELARLAAAHAGIETLEEDLTPLLEGAGAYRRRDEAFRQALPAYGPGWTGKLIVPPLPDADAYRLSLLVAHDPDGHEHRAHLEPDAYQQAVAAANTKQRARMLLAYFHADRLEYAVIGATNRLEYELGFFVKQGDGAADAKPIAHLFKTQVYQLADALGLPSEIRTRPPTTDTYPLEQSQEDFFFGLPFDVLDLVLYAYDHDFLERSITRAVELTADQVAQVFADIDTKRLMARYLHAPARLVAPVERRDQEAPDEALVFEAGGGGLGG